MPFKIFCQECGGIFILLDKVFERKEQAEHQAWGHWAMHAHSAEVREVKQ